VADVESNRAVANRLKRARGQLDAVIRMVEEGRECEPTVMQLAAVTKALDRAGYVLISSGLRECMDSPDEQQRAEAIQKLEKVFLSLA